MNRVFAGALGGFVGTIPMTAVMASLFVTLPRWQRYALPPREITGSVVRRLPLSQLPEERSMTTLTLAAHFGYGALTGALLPLFIGKTQRPLSRGGSFGIAVWALSYLGWIPAARILRPATSHPTRRNVMMLAAHWVWGASAAAVARRLLRGKARV